MTNCKEPCYPYFPATSPIYSKVNTPFSTTKLQVNCKFRHIKTLFSDHQNSVKRPGNGISETLNLKISSGF